MTTLELRLDYDCDQFHLIKKWRVGVQKISRVYYLKRMYLPIINVTKVKHTKKGFHVYAVVRLKESIDYIPETVRWLTLIYQSVLGSDDTRTLFDALRIQREEKDFNLLFDWKNKYLTTDDKKLTDKLNEICNLTLIAEVAHA